MGEIRSKTLKFTDPAIIVCFHTKTVTAPTYSIGRYIFLLETCKIMRVNALRMGIALPMFSCVVEIAFAISRERVSPNRAKAFNIEMNPPSHPYTFKYSPWRSNSSSSLSR